MVAIKIENFTAALDFKKRLDNIITLIKDTPLIEGVDRIYLPGEKEYEEEQKRLKFGVPLSISLITDLLKIAEEAKVNISQYNFLKI
jgi:LDH2 family malate/lactate/ureidoglycolate dehydrogenase